MKRSSDDHSKLKTFNLIFLSSIGTPGSQVFNEIRFSCGSCGHELNLSSANRNTSNFGSKYGKAIKKGFISFCAVDESRFSKKEECKCFPYLSKNPWGIFRRRTRLLCQKCNNFIGVAYEEEDRISLASEISEASHLRKYKIKIGALQPLTSDRV